MAQQQTRQERSVKMVIVLITLLTLSTAQLTAEPAHPTLNQFQQAQPENVESEQQQMWQLIVEISDNFFNLYRSTNLITPKQLFTSRCEQFAQPSATAAALNAEAVSYEADRGLTVNGVYTDSATSDGDEGTAYVELAWDLLGNGQRENRDRARLLREQAELALINHEQRTWALNSRCVAQNIGQAELGNYAALLQMHNQLLTPAEWLERRAYLSGLALFDELLDAQSQLAVTNTELQKIHADPELDRYLTSRAQLPLLDFLNPQRWIFYPGPSHRRD